MANEPVQNGFAPDGRGIVLWVAAIADTSAPTIEEINAATTKRLTYGLAPDGWNLETTINERVLERYTLEQELTSEGTRKYKLTLKYVYDRATPTVAETTLGVKGVPGFLVHALGYPNDHEFEDGDKLNEVVPVRTGTSVTVPPTKNTDAYKQMVPEITGEVREEVTIGGAVGEES